MRVLGKAIADRGSVAEGDDQRWHTGAPADKDTTARQQIMS